MRNPPLHDSGFDGNGQHSPNIKWTNRHQVHMHLHIQHEHDNDHLGGHGYGDGNEGHVGHCLLLR